jgi:hypothetical protein
MKYAPLPPPAAGGGVISHYGETLVYIYSKNCSAQGSSKIAMRCANYAEVS